MSPCSELSQRASTDDDGFTLIEVMVALVLFALLTTAVVPLVISSLRASTVAKLDTAARHLTQERLEALRSLPFHVPPRSDGQPTSPDLLDVYHPSVTDLSTGLEDSGYVTTGARRASEPSGAFYRYVISPVPGFDRYRQYIATQFYGPTGTVVAPPAGWSSSTLGVEPVTLSVGVRVTTTWTSGRLTKSYDVFSAIDAGRQASALVTSSSRTAALRLSSVHAGSDLLLEAGVLSNDGSLTSGPSASVHGQGALAGLTPGTRAEGATRAAVSPPDSSPADSSEPTARTLAGPSAQVLVTFGGTRVERVAARSGTGLPTTGTSADPVVSALDVAGGELAFTNAPSLADADLGLDGSLPVVRSLATSGTVARTAGWSRSTASSPRESRTEAAMTVSELAVLPTAFAPGGLLRVRLTSSTVRCSAGAGAAQGVVQYAASLSYLRRDVVTGTSSYVSAPALNHTNASDPLAGLDLSAIPVAVVGARTLYLSDYLQSLSSQTSPSLAAAVTSAGGRVQVKVPSLVAIATRPLRDGDPLSSVGVQLGVHDCQVEDVR